MSNDALRGTALLTRQALARDRFLAPTWIAILTATCYASGAATASLYPTAADRAAAAEGINSSSAIVALYGPILDVHSLGELAMTKMTVLYAVFVAAMCIVLVRRHTRTEEEAGRAELIAATAVGRLAPMATAVTVGAAASVAVGLLAAAANLAAGLPTEGSILFGASWIGIGWVAVGVTAFACQLSPSSRTCAEIAAAVIGFFYVLRALGDSSANTWLSWFSPFGWSTQLSAWSAPRHWVLLLFVLLGAAFVGSAVSLNARRDLGSGMFPSRPGPRSGAPRLSNVLALTLRLNTPSLLSWTAATAILAGLFGAIVPQVSGLLDSPGARAALERLGGVGAVEDTVFAAVVSILAVVLTAFGVSVVNHSSADERDGRTDHVLATATSRSAPFSATALTALGGTLWLLVVTGAALTLGYLVADGTLAPRLIAATLAQAPAVWLVLSFALVAWAYRNAWTVAGWILLTTFVSIGQFGELLDLPAWITDLSPYSHAALMPVESFDLRTAGSLMALTALVILAAAWCYRRRDVGQ
ncbi:ABC transporter permease [Aeromicrobium sp. P5_D10]